MSAACSCDQIESARNRRAASRRDAFDVPAQERHGALPPMNGLVVRGSHAPSLFGGRLDSLTTPAVGDRSLPNDPSSDHASHSVA